MTGVLAAVSLAGGPLQVAVPEAVSGFVAFTEAVSVLLGLVISYIAFRGYLDHQSRPMFFVALGFVLIVGVPAGLFLVYLAVPAIGETPIALLTQTSKVGGMASILYGLRTRN
ncbi:DUF7521 family protein [Halorussus lipolyticus]|uniref:DUF7521 family protein n=1 Tax=Halorussus lipolyticus TaxID=3034024 RepID=UPI0023E8D814|nr:hypothetical protein [Halorussus sp. DT80]